MLIGAEVPFVSTDYIAGVLFMLLTGKTLTYLSVALSFLEDLFMFLSVLPACMSEQHVCAQCQGVLKSLRSPGPGVRDGYESPCESWKLNTGPP